MRLRRGFRIGCGVLLGLVVVSGVWLYFWLFHDLPSTERFADYVDPAVNSQPVSLSEIPKSLRHAVIVADDLNFYKYDVRYDLAAIGRAILYRYECNCGDAFDCHYTATQRFARQLISISEERDRIRNCLRGSVRETVLAIRIVNRYTKDELLEYYLNVTPFGEENTDGFGVEVAAQVYYGKHVRDLNRAESAMLAAWPWGDPRDNWDLAKQRQERVLELMTEAGYITEEQANNAKDEMILFAQ